MTTLFPSAPNTVASDSAACARQLALLLDLLPEGVVLFGTDGRVEAINRRFFALYNLPDVPADWLGRTGTELRARVQTQVLNPCAFAARGRALPLAGTGIRGEILVLRDGRFLAGDMVAAPAGVGEPGQWLLCLHEVTEQHRLAVEKESLARIPEQNPNPVLRLAASGQLVFANEAARALGLSLARPERVRVQRQLRALAGPALTEGAPQQAELAFGERFFTVRVVPFTADGYVNLYLTETTARVLAEAQVREQKQFYESILNELPAEIFVVDPEYRYRYVNPAAVPDPALRQWMLGRTNTEYSARRGHPTTVAQQRQARLQEVLSGRQRHEWLESLGNDGPRHVLRRLQPVPEAGDDVRLVIGYGLDVTEQETTRQQLREQQEFTQSILDASPSVIYVRNAQHEIIFENTAMQTVRAVARHLTGEALAPGSVEAREVAQLAANDLAVLTTGRELTIEETLTQRDGVQRVFQTVKRPLVRPDGTVHVLGVSTDITALKQTQRTLEHSEKQYRDLMHYAQALICTHTLDGTVLTANPALGERLNCPAEALIGSNVADVMPPEDHAAYAQYLQRIAAEHQASGVQRVRPHGSQELRYLLYRNFLVSEPGQPAYVIAHSHDITERIRAEHEMKRAKEAAESASRAKENFLANMSHEIRTPLNGVLGMARQLGKTRLDAHQQELLRVINTSGQHLLGVINDVLDMAKISAGKLDFEQVAFNLFDSMNQALQPSQLQAQEKGLTFCNQLTAKSLPPAWVVGDPYRLNQILLNLVSNAIKFTKQGSVAVAARPVAETATHLTVEFRVTDTGIGIPADRQAQMFEGFTQAYADTTRHFGGTGLGLSISRALVTQLGGALTVDSAPGTGSTFAFTLTLPTAEAPSLAAPERGAINTGTLAGLRALLVEDNEINREVARFMLEEWGVVLDEAVDGEQGLRMLSRHDYDVALMDIQMPLLSGVEVTQAVRLLPDPVRAQIPILALTANAFREDNERYRAAGMNDTLAKPFDEHELYTKLEALRALPRGAAAYDLTKLRTMAHGRDAFVTKIIRSFLTNTPASLAQLQEAATASQWNWVAEITHHIKPSLEMMGVAGVAHLVAVLEKVPGPTQAATERPALVAQLVALVARALAAVPAELPAETQN
ncbi:PAS domain-containing protein [Hymenobacter convexus]|uniref:PAS domain-containing protein n=1 Tax=Hymenobacter sp. CA1UV-4 TaxID=3063782 RepID=UPI0027132091|nr:PAS domain-containing protein [Hymenobacter sp. CA1UV-4]MDO7853206.1 PAS domain-containing protein [Hymenobacter sp. CA1UV-4]